LRKEETMAIDHVRFHRVASRCVEVAEEQDAPPVLVEVYKTSVEQPLQKYLSASTAVQDAWSHASAQGAEASEALAALDGPYRVARSATAAVVRNVKLPDTLKAQPTDTDKQNAIERLLDVINQYAGQPWADVLLTGEFGQKGAAALKEVGEAIEADKALQKARSARAQAFGPAWKAYRSFKRLVRDALGASSKQYRRIHVRSGAGLPEVGEDEEAPPSVG
jgi:hypothetical protein